MSNPNFPVIPNYEVQELLAQGRNTCIFKAKHELSRRTAVVKILLPQAAAVPILVVRLQQEAKALSRCNHKGVLIAYDFGMTVNQFPYLVLDYLPGITLGGILQEQRTIELDDFNRLFFEVCDAVAHIHKCGIVHRELKPANLMTLPEDAASLVKIIDFGTAKILNDDRPPAIAPDTPGEVRGTPAYLSPEQIMGQEADARSDIFSLGCTMFESLTGYSPFLGANDRETVQNVVNREPPPMVQIKPELAGIAPTILRCLLKSPNDRFQSMQELGEALRGVAHINTAS